MSNEDYTINCTIRNLSEAMKWEDMQDAWEDIHDAWQEIFGAIDIFRTACKNRLKKLGYDEDEYEEGSNEKIDAVLELLRNTEDLVDELPF